jgi:hypothetical protein
MMERCRIMGPIVPTAEMFYRYHVVVQYALIVVIHHAVRNVIAVNITINLGPYTFINLFS